MASGKFQVLPNVFSSSELPLLPLLLVSTFPPPLVWVAQESSQEFDVSFPLSLLSDAVRPQLGNCLVNSPLATLTQVTVQVRALALLPFYWQEKPLTYLCHSPGAPNRHATGVRRFTQCKGRERWRDRGGEVLEGTQVFISSCPRCWSIWGPSLGFLLRIALIGNSLK